MRVVPYGIYGYCSLSTEIEIKAKTSLLSVSDRILSPRCNILMIKRIHRTAFELEVSFRLLQLLLSKFGNTYRNVYSIAL